MNYFRGKDSVFRLLLFLSSLYIRNWGYDICNLYTKLVFRFMKKEATGTGTVTSFSLYYASAGRLYIHLLVFIRRTTYVLFEQTGEMLCILKSQSVGYFGYGLVGIYNPVFGKADELG